MKKFKNLMIAIITLLAITTFIGCGKEEKEFIASNLKIEYKATVDVDEVICNVGDQELEITPMHDDKKVKSGYSITSDLPREKDVKVSIKIIDNNKTIYENNNLNVDLSGENKVYISIVGDKLNNLKAEITSK